MHDLRVVPVQPEMAWASVRVIVQGSDSREGKPYMSQHTPHTQLSGKSTPGPWTAEDIPGQPRHMFRIADAENCLICESESTRPDGWANARLIAAAPEMQTLVYGVLETQWNKLVEDFPLEAAHLKGLSGLARALLARIEGRE